MTGPTPLTATHRLTMLYTVNLFQHKQQNYCSVVAGTGPSGYALGARTGFATPNVEDAVNRFFTKAAPFYNPTWSAFDGWLLQVRTGTTWTYLASGTTTVSPSGAGAYEIANGLCMSGKDSAQKNLPAYIYEGSFGTATKLNSPGALGASARSLVNYFWDVDGAAISTDAWNWRVSRGFAEAQRWLAWVTDTNEKLRRIRRIK